MILLTVQCIFMVLGKLGHTCNACSSSHVTFCRLTENAELLTGTLQAILFGSAAEGISPGILDDEYVRHLLLDPVCLRQDSSNCRATTDTYYTVSQLQSFTALTQQLHSVQCCHL